jgi:predicted permease
MHSFILIFTALLFGYLLQRSRRLSAEIPHYLNKFIIFIALPAMILLEVPKLSFTHELFIPVAISWIVMISSALLVLIASAWLHFSKEVTGALMLVSVLTNSTFLGIPIIHAYFGSVALPFIIVYDQVGSFLALATYGTIITALYAHKSRVNLSIIFIKIISFPPFIALLLALFAIQNGWPENIQALFEFLSATIAPIALLAVGMQLQFRLPKEEIKPFVVSLTIKLCIAPMMAILTAYILGWQGIATQVSIMEAGMAPMVTAAAMASMVGLAPRLSSAIVGYGILFSLLSTAIIFVIIS